MPVPRFDFLRALQFFSVFVLDAERAADFLHNVLIRRGHIAAGGLFTAGVRLAPVCVELAACQRGSPFGMLANAVMKRRLAGLGGRCLGCVPER